MNRQQAIGARIKRAREEAGLSQAELGKMVGWSDANVSRIEKGTVSISIGDLERVGRVVGQTLNWFLSDQVEIPPRPIGAITSELQQALERLEVREIPIRGAVPAGYPFPEEEQMLGTVIIPQELLKGASNLANVYALKVAGDSLKGDGIYSGDYVVVDPGAPFVDGKIYAVKIGNEVCARHVNMLNDHARLSSSNGDYKDIQTKDLQILGRIILSTRFNKL